MNRPDMRTFLSLYHLCLVVEEIVRRTCRDKELSMNETAVLCALDGGPFECSHMARNLGRARQNVHRSLEVLRKRGFVDVERYLDSQRVAMWRLTEKGETYLYAVTTRFKNVELRLRNRVSQFDSTIVNLEVLVEELDRAKTDSALALYVRPPKPRDLNVNPD